MMMSQLVQMMCHSDCSDEVHAEESSYTKASWCGDYNSECLGGDELPCHDEYIDFLRVRGKQWGVF